MPLFFKNRILYKLLRVKSEVILKNGERYTGVGDCCIDLPISDDTEEEAEYLSYDTTDGKTIFIREEDIEEYKILEKEGK